MNGDNGTSTQAPQMRALLFTDLCDSLMLVERIGDAAAAELFQQHDRLVLTLQQQWNGHQIDRSDGLFLLFERAIDALGFALDYQRGLQQIGEQRGIVLRARAGLHVGEVLTWENSPEAIKVGAKSMEVEGLAKPMAARLMMLARPGQILLSAVAESLIHRATGALGERGERLLWKSHGRWRFKGVPTVQEVIEVGEIGSAPLRMPRANAKARRDLPLWRQPAALAIELVLLATVVVGGWFFLRPTPAIAFAERDWVVLGDVRNLTGDALLDDSMEQALRISLEQSRYVNVLSDLKVRDTLARMNHGLGSPMDREAAIEVAVRDGARAVIMPAILEVHGKLRVSVEIVDPRTRDTVYSEYADGHGLESVLSSTDQVVAKMRGRLGEALQNVSRDSQPLPQVATRNLDALHAYAKALEAYGSGRYDDALPFFEQAAKIDQDFAFAYVGQMRVHVARGDTEKARAAMQRAIALNARMPPRDALYLDAWAAQLKGSRISEAAEKWKLLADLYPDYHGAHANYAFAAFTLGRYNEAERAASKAAVTQNPLQSIALLEVARAQVAQGKLAPALETYRRSARVGDWKDNRNFALALAFNNEVAAANKMLANLPSNDISASLARSALAIDQGDLEGARAALRSGMSQCSDKELVCGILQVQMLGIGALSETPPVASSYAHVVEQMLGIVAQEEAGERNEWLFMAAAVAYTAQRAGHGDVALRQLPALQHWADALNDERASQMIQLVIASKEKADGSQAAALVRLRGLINGRELFQVHSALLEMQAATAQADARSETMWLASHRGLAYAENAGSYSLQVLNLHDSRQARLALAEQAL